MTFTTPTHLDAPALALIDTCARASLELLQSNLTPHGILAASRTEAAVARRYTRIFGRDAAICVMAMCGTGVPALEQGAVASLDALASQQAANGQIPKYVDPEGQDANIPQCTGNTPHGATAASGKGHFIGSKQVKRLAEKHKNATIYNTDSYRWYCYAFFKNEVDAGIAAHKALMPAA